MNHFAGALMDERPNWARAHDMRVLQEQIDKQEFKALSPGIGLGVGSGLGSGLGPKKTAAIAGRRHAVPSKNASNSRGTGQTAGFSRASGSSGSIGPEKGAVGRPRSTPSYAAPSWGLRIQAYVMDFFLVVTTLATAFAGVTVYFAVKAGGIGEVWGQRPVQLLAQTSPLVTLGLVYAIYLVYTLFFKLLVGSTCGESLLGIYTKIRPSVPTAKQKNF
jgi:hypothetical protein